MKKHLVFGVIAVIAITITSFAIWSPMNHIMAGKDYLFSTWDPDIPGFLTEQKNEFSKEDFMRMRAEGVALKRGLMNEELPDPAARPRAIEKMEEQERAVVEKSDSPATDAVLAAWMPIGPAPIPNGQTTPTAPVSGRVTAIAVHPTNPNIVYVGAAQGGVYRSIDGGTNWTQLFDSAQSLAIGAIAIAPSDPEIVYVGTGEPNFSGDSFFGVGVYRINNAGTTADLTGPLNKDAGGNDVFTGRGIGEILVHPTQPGTIFVCSTSGVAGLRSTNGPFPSRGVYRSTNADTATPTFAKLTGLAANINASVRDMALDPQNPDNLVANLVAGGGTGGIYTTNNALNADPTTVTFTQTVVFNSGSTSELTAEFAVQKTGGTNGARTYYAATGNLGGRVLRSTDSGATWTQQIDNDFCTPQCFYDIAVDIDPTNTANVYLGGAPNLIFGKSVTSGTAFVPATAGLHVDTHAITVAPSDPTIIFLGTDGGIYKSTDSGVTFLNLNNTQFSATQFVGFDVHPTDPNFSLGGTQDNGTNFYQPTAMWRRADFGDGGFTVIDQNAPDVVNVRMYHTYFNAGNLQGYGTVNNVASAMDNGWAFRGCQATNATVNGITCNGAINFYAPLERGPGNPNTIYYGSDRLYRSANEGLNHTVVSQNPIVAGVPLSSIGISPQNDNVRIVGLNNGGLFGTSTGANPLVDLDPTNTVPNVAINRSIIDPNNPATAYVALSVFGSTGGVVYKTTNLGDTGTTWTNSSGTGATGLPLVPVDVIVVDPLNSNNVYVGTDIGVYASTDAGATWAPFGTGLPRVAVFDMKITPTRLLRIATHGRGVFQIPILAPTAASVTVAGRVSFSNGFGLGNAVVTLTNSNGDPRTTQTSSFGYFKFEDVEVGETYTVTVRHKRYSFTPQVITVIDNVEDLNLFPQ